MRKASLCGLTALTLFALAGCGGGEDGGGASTNTFLVAFSANGTLRFLDPATGAATGALVTSYFNGTNTVPLGRVSSCIYNAAAGEIWVGMGGRNTVCDGCIMRLNGTSGAASMVSNPGLRGVPGLAISSTNRLFMHEGDNPGLYEIDNVTGATMQVAASAGGNKGNGMTFGADGAFYLCSDGGLYVVEQVTFVASLIAALTKAGFPTDIAGQVVAMATRPSDGAVFAIWKDSAGGGGMGADAYLVTVDTTSGLMTYVGTLPGSFDGLAFLPGASLGMP
jgi:hypothetical protein